MQRTVILCVVFGAFGDLFKKKLLRALYYFWQDKPEQDELRVILTDIKDLTQEGLDKDSWLDALGAYNELQGPEFVEFCRCLSYRSVNCLDKKTHFQQLRKEMDRVKEEVQGQDEVTLKRFYYLALPPAYFLRTFNSIKSCLELNSSEGDRMILEKPIGIDREFSRDLYDHIGGRFPQPYLRTMDHFGFKPHVPYLLSKLYGDPARNELYTEVHVERVLFYA
jgi:glucose-6-phosphate 1-dehydrogenase